MGTLILVLGSILLVFALYTVLAPLALNRARFAGSFKLPCPEKHVNAAVKVRANGAALAVAYGSPHVRMRRCSLLLPGQGCNETCLKGLAA